MIRKDGTYLPNEKAAADKFNIHLGKEEVCFSSTNLDVITLDRDVVCRRNYFEVCWHLVQ